MSRSALRISIGNTAAGTIVAFLLTLGVCFLLVFAMIFNRVQVERLTMEQLISEKSVRINNVMSRLLFRVHTLSSYIQHNKGEIADFMQLASMLTDDPAILNMLIAPGGVVSQVYPLEGNEAVLGLNFMTDDVGNREAAMAIETRQLVLAGPFVGVQGRVIMVGRLPVFISDKAGGERFWGIVSVTLAHPQALDGAALDDLSIMGFGYEIWRRNPDDNEMQLITSSQHSHQGARYIEMPISILNANWYFRILAVRAWYEFPETWIAIFIGIFASLMIATVVQSNHDLKNMRD
ncbi:MAG: CHASE domain-containing protein, partial [Treponema sp.]|nr:CHASE domain-containing protein [Treponema sp.]